MTFTIEPMITEGVVGARAHLVRRLDRADTRPARARAQFEHTLLVTATGAEVLHAAFPSEPHGSWNAGACGWRGERALVTGSTAGYRTRDRDRVRARRRARSS